MVNSGWCSGPRSRLRIDVGEGEQPRLAGGEQLLAGELGRGVQIEPARAAPSGPIELGREGVQMRLVAGRDLQDRGLDLDEVALRRTSRAGPPGCALRREQERAPVGVDVRRATRARRRSSRQSTRLDETGSGFGDRRRAESQAIGAGAPALVTQGSHHGKVIASSLRKGNVVDHRRQALRRPDGAEHPSRQGHAGDPARPAPHQRRREGLRALPHHRAGRARLSSSERAHLSSTRMPRASTS